MRLWTKIAWGQVSWNSPLKIRVNSEGLISMLELASIQPAFIHNIVFWFMSTFLTFSFRFSGWLSTSLGALH